MRKGDFIELTIDDLAFGARGVARQDGFVWFVEGGIPGQKVQAVIRRKRKHYGEARIHEIITPGPDQIEAPCPYFGVCGGCQLQHLKYEAQAESKFRQVQELIQRVGHVTDCDFRPIKTAKIQYGYRNKMEFTFSPRRWVIHGLDDEKPVDFALGLHAPGRFDKVIDIDRCLLQSETANQLLVDIKSLICQTGQPSYHIRNHQGFWRFLVFREGMNTQELMVQIITSSQAPEKGDPVFKWLMHKLFWKHLELTSVVHGISNKKAQVAYSDEESVILGDGKLREKIGSCLFEISSNAFFQTNTYQTEVLFDTILELADFSGNEIVYDLYCGTGPIGLYIANHVKQVVGIEVISSAVEDGRRNASLNNLDNIVFIQGDMKHAIHEAAPLIQQYGRADTVILDPPRGGTHPDTIRDLLQWLPPRLIYMSCNPPMLAKDLAELQSAYTVRTVQPVDMFPQTKHIEVVCALQRKE
ncbi:23S rRNA (uracil(1939)-C(5))-methyltransferase RlmD [bacterium]|nr:23S rRNA (uracil(1939)-C(5))-methyltransferase RlmD [bacterium]